MLDDVIPQQKDRNGELRSRPSQIEVIYGDFPWFNV